MAGMSSINSGDRSKTKLFLINYPPRPSQQRWSRANGGGRRITAGGFHHAFSARQTDEIDYYRQLKRVEKLQAYDVVAYKIDQVQECDQAGGRNDTGHIFILLEAPVEQETAGDYKLYKVKIADSTSMTSGVTAGAFGHWPGGQDRPDSRARDQHSGVGFGWVYLWAERQGGELVGVSVKQVQGLPSANHPSERSLRCHKFSVARFGEARNGGGRTLFSQ